MALVLTLKKQILSWKNVIDGMIGNCSSMLPQFLYMTKVKMSGHSPEASKSSVQNVQK